MKLTASCLAQFGCSKKTKQENETWNDISKINDSNGTVGCNLKTIVWWLTGQYRKYVSVNLMSVKKHHNRHNNDNNNTNNNNIRSKNGFARRQVKGELAGWLQCRAAGWPGYHSTNSKYRNTKTNCWTNTVENTNINTNTMMVGLDTVQLILILCRQQNTEIQLKI